MMYLMPQRKEKKIENKKYRRTRKPQSMRAPPPLLYSKDISSLKIPKKEPPVHRVG
jgi:hypothetical protein